MTKGVTVEVTYAGSSDTRSGSVTLKFLAPFSEVSAFSRLVMYTKTQVFLFAKWDSSDDAGAPLEREEQIATCVYYGKNEDHDGEATLKFRTDVNSLFPEVLNRLKQDCAEGVTSGGKTFLLTVLSADDIGQQITQTP